MKAFRGFWLAPLIAAALLWASFAPVDFGFLAPFAWAALFLSMRLRGGERAGWQSFVGHYAFFLAGLWWISPLVSIGWAFVALWCATIEGFFGRCLKPALRAARDRGSWTWVIAAPLLHLGFDMIRTTLATGFPWLITGYSGWRNPVLIGSADLIGVHGSTLAIVALGAAIAEVVARRIEGRPIGRAPWVPAAGVWAAFAIWAIAKPAIETRPGPNVLLLQASIPQELKEARDASGHALPTLDEWWGIHEREAAAGRADFPNYRDLSGFVDLVVWPETMVPTSALAPVVEGRRFLAAEPIPGSKQWRLGESACRRLTAASHGASTLAGIMTEDAQRKQRNTAILLDPEGLVAGSQDKQHLTPGGETLLFLEWLPGPLRATVEQQLREFAGFVPGLVAGAGPRLLPLRTGGSAPPSASLQLGVLICYESIFPELPRAMARDGADVIVNISNYGWFTGTSQMDQALAMACFRAAELRRPVVLASNNGISAVIGADGYVTARTDADVRTHLLAEVPLASGTTLFTLVGEWAAWVLGVAGAVFLTVSKQRTRTEAPKSS
ncbi:MAG: apolipoprotein N-acyltransferase [Planctomycetes bacterium]|nr:apolipoprotein N-acyltransferase [Planctomycetota bacterium]